MKTPDDIWDDIGSLSEDEMFHVVTKLFAQYEAKIQNQPNNPEALTFFKHLGAIIDETRQCNSNRR